MNAGETVHVAVPGGAVLLLDVLPGWAVGDTGGVAAVLVRERPPSGFRTNAMVQTTTVPATVTLDDVVAAAGARFAATHGAVDDRGSRPTRMGEADGIVRLVCFDLGPQAVRLAQLQAFVDGGVVGGDGTTAERRAVVTVALTCAAVDLPELGDELAAVVRRARLVRPDDQP
jgi:hypothetical protein